MTSRASRSRLPETDRRLGTTLRFQRANFVLADMERTLSFYRDVDVLDADGNLAVLYFILAVPG